MNASLAGSRILLVEDSAVNRLVAREVLRSFDLEVVEAEDGEEALSLLAAGRYDLVLMDVQMPRLDGDAATRRIRADGRWPGLPVIAMTGLAAHGERESCLAAGMNDLVTKPIDRQRLHEVLSRWLRPGVAEARGSGGIPAAVAGIELKSALERMNGHWPLLRSLLLEFARQHGETVGRIRAAMTARTPDGANQALRMLHAIKGEAGNLAALGLYEATRALEEGIARNERSRWRMLLDGFEQALRQVLEGVAALPPEEAPREESPACQGMAGEKFRILIVDDVPGNIKILAAGLRARYDISMTTQGAEALRIAERNRPDLVLLDVLMPGMDGYEVCRRLRENPRTAAIPVIFVSALGENGDEEQGFAAGGVDFIVKPCSNAMLLARVGMQMELKMARARIGQLERELCALRASE